MRNKIYGPNFIGEILPSGNPTSGMAKGSQRGATMIEYVLILCCMTLVIVASVSFVGAQTRETFDATGYAIAAHTNFNPNSTSTTTPPPPPPPPPVPPN